MNDSEKNGPEKTGGIWKLETEFNGTCHWHFEFEAAIIFETPDAEYFWSVFYF